MLRFGVVFVFPQYWTLPGFRRSFESDSKPAPSFRTGLRRWVKPLTNLVSAVASGLVANGERVLAHYWHGISTVGSGRGIIADLISAWKIRMRDASKGKTAQRALFNENFGAYLTALPPSTIGTRPVLELDFSGYPTRLPRSWLQVLKSLLGIWQLLFRRDR